MRLTFSSAIFIAGQALLFVLAATPACGVVLPASFKSLGLGVKDKLHSSLDHQETFSTDTSGSGLLPNRATSALPLDQNTDSEEKADDLPPISPTPETQQTRTTSQIGLATAQRVETTTFPSTVHASSTLAENTEVPTAEKNLLTTTLDSSVSSTAQAPSTTLNLPTTTHPTIKTSESPTTSTSNENRSPSKPVATLNSHPALLLGETLDLRLDSAQPNFYSGPKIPVSDEGTKTSARQILVKLFPSQNMLSTPSSRSSLRASVSDTIVVQLCGEYKSAIYLFDVDPSKAANSVPLFSSTGHEPQKAGCLNEARIEISDSLAKLDLYLVVLTYLPPTSLPARAATLALRKESSTASEIPWNVNTVRRSFKKSPGSLPVDSSAWRAFVLASAPLRKHVELKDASIHDFSSNFMDPFCDSTGTAMISLLAGKNLGLASNPHIVPMPIGGCGKANNVTDSIRLALLSVDEELAKKSEKTTRNVVVIQDSPGLQQSLKGGLFETEFRLIAEKGGVIILPASNCRSEVEASAHNFVLVAGFGMDQASSKPFVTAKQAACINSFDVLVPGIDVISAGSFGESARQQYTDASLAAATLAGTIISIASSGDNVGKFNTSLVIKALRNLKTTPVGSQAEAGATVKARVLGADDVDDDYATFAAILMGKTVGENENSKGNNDRIVSSLSNPTFYSLTAVVGLVCVAAIAGVIFLIGFRSSNDGSGTLSFVADDEENPQVPPPIDPASPNSTQSIALEKEVMPDVIPEKATEERKEQPVDLVGVFSDRNRSDSDTAPGVKKEEAGDLAGAIIPNGKIEPLNMAFSQTNSENDNSKRQSAPVHDRSGPQHGIGKRQVVKTRLLTLTKKSGPETPGASKASWFSTPKSSQARRSSFSKREGSQSKTENIEASESDNVA